MMWNQHIPSSSLRRVSRGALLYLQMLSTVCFVGKPLHHSGTHWFPLNCWPADLKSPLSPPVPASQDRLTAPRSFIPVLELMLLCLHSKNLTYEASPHWDLESGTCSLCGLLFWYMMVTFRVKVWTSGLKASSSFQWDSLVPFTWQMLFCVVRKIRQKKKQQSCKNAFRLVCWRRSRLQCGDYPKAECPGAGGVNLALPGDQIKKRI